MEAFGVIYFLGFIITFFIGVVKAVDHGEPIIVLLSPVWPIIYLKVIFCYIKGSL